MEKGDVADVASTQDLQDDDKTEVTMLGSVGKVRAAAQELSHT